MITLGVLIIFGSLVYGVVRSLADFYGVYAIGPWKAPAGVVLGTLVIAAKWLP